ncbi:MAG: M48 family metalloprotease [Candidatus Aenigmatarchaeota archaeon]
MAFFRTTLLLGLLTGILLAIGFAFAGIEGMTIALLIAIIINFFSYYYSDKIVISMYRARPTKDEKLNKIVKKLSENSGLPMPKIYIVDMRMPNAFATGRNPRHAAVVVTRGLIENLNEEEIEGVLSHELAHIKNHDILVSTIAAVVAGAITYLADMAWWSMLGNNRQRGRGVLLLPLLILAPISAMLIRMAISRGREFGADYTGALISKNPLGLASALEKISSFAEQNTIRGNSATSHLWIVNPFKDSFANLFSTHPPTKERIRRLREMKI